MLFSNRRVVICTTYKHNVKYFSWHKLCRMCGKFIVTFFLIPCLGRLVVSNCTLLAHIYVVPSDTTFLYQVFLFKRQPRFRNEVVSLNHKSPKRVANITTAISLCCADSMNPLYGERSFQGNTALWVEHCGSISNFI